MSDKEDPDKVHPAVRAVLDAIQNAGGTVHTVQLDQKDGGDEDSGTVTRKEICEAIADADRKNAQAFARFEQELGADQDVLRHKSGATISGFILKRPEAFSYALTSYKEALGADKVTKLASLPTGEECLRFQVVTSVHSASYALDLGLFAGAILGRGGLTHDEILRLVTQPYFTSKILTLQYRPEDLCNFARETLERMDQIAAKAN